ncbi:MAG TPA: transposase [Gammaproteobacteria bacterium]
MPNYRRYFVPGGTFFFTTNLARRFPNDLLVREVAALRDAVRRVRVKFPFEIDAWVVLPDHMHCIWTLPPGDVDYARRWRLIKGGFSKSLPVASDEVSRQRGRGIWQHRYWEHAIRDQRDFIAHMNYIHFNPVKHGHVARVRDWPYSTFHREVSAGVYPGDWGEDVAPDYPVGER